MDEPSVVRKLNNCPNCGGIIDDGGRCKYCGSKVYDFCDIDISGGTRTFIKMRINNGDILVAPVYVRTATITIEPDAVPSIGVDFTLAGEMRCYPDT